MSGRDDTFMVGDGWGRDRGELGVRFVVVEVEGGAWGCMISWVRTSRRGKERKGFGGLGTGF